MLRIIAVVGVVLLALTACENDSQNNTTTITTTQPSGDVMSNFERDLAQQKFVQISKTQQAANGPEGDTDFQQWQRGNVTVQLAGNTKGARVKHIIQSPVGKWAMVLCAPAPAIEADALKVVGEFEQQIKLIGEGKVDDEPSGEGSTAFKLDSADISCSGLGVTE